MAENSVDGAAVAADVVVSAQRRHQMQEPTLLRADLEVLEELDAVKLSTRQAAFVVAVGRGQRRVDGNDVDVVNAKVAVVAEDVTLAGSLGPMCQSSDFGVSFAQCLDDRDSEILDGIQEDL